VPFSDEQIIRAIREFIQSNFLYMRPDFVLGEDDQFLQNRVLDSMGVMELVLFLRSEFGIEVPETDILEANLGSLRAVAEYVRSRPGVQEPA
jgi:acyl carrier protein